MPLLADVAPRDRKRIIAAAILWIIAMTAGGISIAWVTSHHGRLNPFEKYDTLQHLEWTGRLNRDGSLDVNETIRIRYDGDFHGTYRDINLQPGQQLENITVSEGSTSYVPGIVVVGVTTGNAGTYQASQLDTDTFRIAWMHEASNQTRTFTLRYRARGLVTAHNDVDVLHIQPWGDGWQRRLGSLDATLMLPESSASLDRGLPRAWVHALDTDTSLKRRAATFTLKAKDVPRQHFVELRAVLDPATLSLDATTRPATATQPQTLKAIQAEERRFEADRVAGDNIRRAVRQAMPLLIALALLASALPPLLLIRFVWRRYGREHEIAAPGAAVSTPPDTLPPALTQLLTDQTDSATTDGFVATVFDLVRRGRYITEPAYSGTHGSIVDIAITPGNVELPLHSFENPGCSLIDRVCVDGSVAMSDLDDRLEEHREVGAVDFKEFQDLVAGEVRSMAWYETSGGWILVLPLVACLAGAMAFTLGFDPLDRSGPFMVLQWLLVLVCAGNAAALGVAVRNRKLIVRRRREVATQAAAWDGFRSFLDEYAHMEHEEPASLPLWEQYLTHAIAFGCAEGILRNCSPRLDSPDDQFRYDHGLRTMVMADSFNLTSFSSAMSTGTTVPSSDSSGGGGSFGGGSIGGGGGSW